MWLALLALGLFVALYLGLVVWLGMRTYDYLYAAITGGNGGGYLAALPTLFLFIFLVKALFFRDRDKHRQSLQVTPAEEPALFAFLHQVADEAGAPRPHKVFLSPDVNAGVFYDLSVLNFFFPSKKNLRIGLGLVNALSLSEFKAVLAHEFGHFGQRAMAVGSWVYTAQRIAGHIVHRRDVMDRFLMGVSRIDLRVAWIGWIMRTIVWALRSVLDTAFTLAVLAERSLTRKMEFQADLVAVSLSGSDAIVHALNKLGPADDAFDQAANLILSEHNSGRRVADLYAVQTKAIERLRVVLGKPYYGTNPPLPAVAPESHRVFERNLATPPRMWSTHPSNEDREENAKRVYIACDNDDRSAWALFSDAPGLRRRMTAFLVESVLTASEKSAPPATDAPREETDGMSALEMKFDRPHLDPAYQGAYLGRSAVRAAEKAAELYPATLPARSDWSPAYPEAMALDIARLKAVEEEYATLLGLQRGLLQVGGGALHHRGRLLRRKDLPKALDEVAAERSTLRATVAAHDRRVRGIHLAAAQAVGHGWPEYLRGAAALLHYADHTEANLRDAVSSYHNVLAIITADGKVSKSEATRLISEGLALHTILSDIEAQARDVILPAPVATRLDEASWRAALPEHFDLAPPAHGNLGDWNEVLGSWLSAYGAPLDVLERAALDHLLSTEREVMRMATGEAPTVPAPEPPRVPARYATLPPGREREKQWRLGWWDRFQVADGFFPQLARFAVSGAVVAAFVWGMGQVGALTIVVHNGLGRTVIVDVGGKTKTVGAGQSVRLERGHHATLPIVATTDTGETIEAFIAEVPHPMGTYVYNVAGADPLVRWDALYGAARSRGKGDETLLGAPRFASTDATVLFEDPPSTVRTKSGSAVRHVLTAVDAEPDTLIGLAKTDQERESMIATHATWDPANRRSTSLWLALAERLPGAEAIARKRLALNAGDVPAHRLLQDLSVGEARTKRCAEYRAAATRKADDPDAAYLAARCVEKEEAKNEAFLRAYERFPRHPWIAYAAGYARAEGGDFDGAISIFDRIVANPELPEQVVLDQARLLRLRGRNAEARRLSKHSRTLEAFLAMEHPSAQEGRDGPYSALGRGDLEKALASAQGHPGEARVRLLVGASDKADAAAVKRALSVDGKEAIDRHSLWAALGLRMREKRDVSALLDAIPAHARPDAAPILRRCAEAVAAGTSPRELEAKLAGLLPDERGHVLVMATVAMGDKTPRILRDGARALLFVPERPSL